MSIETTIIYPSQIEDFKHQTNKFADNLKSFANIKLSKFKRLDLVARCFGHKNFSTLQKTSKFHHQQDPNEPFYMFRDTDWINRFKQVLIDEEGLSLNEIELVCACSSVNTDQMMHEGLLKLGGMKLGRGESFTRRLALPIGAGKTEFPQLRQGKSNLHNELILSHIGENSEVMMRVLKERDAGIGSIEFDYDPKEFFKGVPQFTEQESKGPSYGVLNPLDTMNKAEFELFMMELARIDYSDEATLAGIEKVVSCLGEIYQSSKLLYMDVTLGVIVFWLECFESMAKQDWLKDAVIKEIESISKNNSDSIEKLSSAIKKNAGADSVIPERRELSFFLIDEVSNSESAIAERKALAKIREAEDKKKKPNQEKGKLLIDVSKARQSVYEAFLSHDEYQKLIIEANRLGCYIEFIEPDNGFIENPEGIQISVSIDTWAKEEMPNEMLDAWNTFTDWLSSFSLLGNVSIKQRTKGHYWHHLATQSFLSEEERYEKLSVEDKYLYDMLKGKIGNTIGNPLASGNLEKVTEKIVDILKNGFRYNND